MSSTPLPKVYTSFPDYAKAVVPADGADLTDHSGNPTPQTIRVGGAGDVSYIPFRNTDAQTITETFAAGAIIPVMVRRVRSTGTTATALVGYF